MIYQLGLKNMYNTGGPVGKAHIMLGFALQRHSISSRDGREGEGKGGGRVG